MLRGVFVTGTDTNVGKTVVAAALFHRYRHQIPLRYWKPIQTGIEQDDDTRDVRRLGSCADEELLTSGIRLRHAVSPHRAARESGTTIDLGALTAIAAAQPADRRWIVEGAGGALVPINETDLMADLMVRLNLPVLVVARTALGTINHTLMTLEALRARSLSVAGVVMCGLPDAENRTAIERYGDVRVLGELPVQAPLDAGNLAAWAETALDPDGHLLGLLQ